MREFGGRLYAYIDISDYFALRRTMARFHPRPEDWVREKSEAFSMI